MNKSLAINRQVGQDINNGAAKAVSYIEPVSINLLGVLIMLHTAPQFISAQCVSCVSRVEVQSITDDINCYIKQIKKALSLQANLGTRAAAGYLRNQGVPCEIAVYVLSRFRISYKSIH